MNENVKELNEMIYQCRICGNTQNHQFITAREMMFGYRDEFLYFKCHVCGCLQIADIPDDLSKYYPTNYYSYRQESKFWDIFKNIPILKYGVCLKRFGLNFIPILRLLKTINKNAAILDVGCGVGHLLLEMKKWGYSDLTGIDPFIESDIRYESGVKILKQDLSEHKRNNGAGYDLIMLHHSFEHMPEPHTVFSDIGRNLNDDGLLLIRIPVSDTFAFHKYQHNWVQLDAPRHLYLHTAKSISYLAKEYDLVIKDIIFDSSGFQIEGSEGYCRDITLIDQEHNKILLKLRCMRYMREANRLNKIKAGDQCCFILSKH